MPILKQVRSTILDHHLFSKGETVVVGVSGGPDSLTLLHILRDLSKELGIELHVAHLNHKLRGASSDADASFVAGTARAWGLPATTKAQQVSEYSKEKHLSLEEAARIIRYKFLAEVARTVGARAVAVGHHGDDQVETILMHLLRGAGLAGLRGMTYLSPFPYVGEDDSAEAPTIQLVRPLLDVQRAEIEAYCRANGLLPQVDASNSDTHIFRNRLRIEVLPYLERINPNLRQVIRHGAHALSDDYDYLNGMAREAFSNVMIPEGGAAPAHNLARYVFDRERWRALPPSLQRGTLREAVKRLRRGLRNINWTHIEDARRVALEKGVGSEATLPTGLAVVVGYGEITIGETVKLPDIPLVHDSELRLKVGESRELPDSGWQVRVEESRNSGGSTQLGFIHRDTWTAEFDADKVRGSLSLRVRRPGERFEPKGLGGHHKSLHEYMIEEKIPRQVRDLLPILADDEKVLWVCGYRIDRRAKVNDRTERIITVGFLRLPVST